MRCSAMGRRRRKVSLRSDFSSANPANPVEEKPAISDFTSARHGLRVPNPLDGFLLVRQSADDEICVPLDSGGRRDWGVWNLLRGNPRVNHRDLVDALPVFVRLRGPVHCGVHRLEQAARVPGGRGTARLCAGHSRNARRRRDAGPGTARCTHRAGADLSGRDTDRPAAAPFWPRHRQAAVVCDRLPPADDSDLERSDQPSAGSQPNTLSQDRHHPARRRWHTCTPTGNGYSPAVSDAFGYYSNAAASIS